jgi:hypothetical protein
MAVVQYTLSPGGSTHLHTNNTQNNTNNNRTTQITINVEECRPCPVFACYTVAFVLQLRKKQGKTSIRVRNKDTVQFLPYGRSIGSCICLTHKTYTCHTVQCCACRLYFFLRTSNYVQRKTYTRKAATVHLNCSTVPCNTLCEHIVAAVPCHTLCARIAGAV